MWDEDETMIDLGGGMVVPLSEVIDDDMQVEREHTGHGQPLTGIDVPLGEWAEVTGEDPSPIGDS